MEITGIRRRRFTWPAAKMGVSCSSQEPAPARISPRPSPPPTSILTTPRLPQPVLRQCLGEQRPIPVVTYGDTKVTTPYFPADPDPAGRRVLQHGQYAPAHDGARAA